jgi:hypothetical protein
MYKLAITTLSTTMFLSAVGYGAAARPSDTKSAGTGLHPVSIRGSVLGFDGSSLAGADVCVYENASEDVRGCTTSGGDGSFSLATAANEPVIVTVRKDGFAPTVRAIETVLADSHQGQTAFFVTAPGTPPTTASVTRTAADSRAPFYFSVVLGREEMTL